MVTSWQVFCCFCSVAKSCPTLCDQAPLSSIISGVYSDSCQLSRWCFLTISSCAAPFSFYLQSFPASEFPVSQLFALGSQNIGTTASASILPMNIRGWFPLRLTGLISLLSKGLSKESSLALQFKSINSLVLSLLYGPTLTSIRDYWKSYSFDFDIQTFDSKVMSLFFNKLSRLLIAFLPRNKHLLITWLPVTICSDFGAQENKICHCFHFILPMKWWDLMPWF